MLPFTAAGTFFRLGETTDLPRTYLRRDGREKWTRGKKLIGLTNRQTLITDGTEDATFSGHEWVATWDNRPGYTVYSSNALSHLVFLTGSPTLVFIGEPAVFSFGVGPLEVAIETKSIHPASRPEAVKGCRHAHDLPMLEVLADGGGIEVCLRHGFKPHSALSRDQWRKLGYHIPTRAAAALEGVCPIYNPSGFTVPFSTIEDCEENGFSPEIAGATMLRGAVRLTCKSLRITDPEKAGAVFPFFARLSAGTKLVTKEFPYSEDPNGLVWVEFAEAERLIRIPATELTIQHNSAPAVRLNIKDITVPAGETISATYHGARCAFVSNKDLDSLFISARKAGGRYHVPMNVSSGEIFADGELLPGQYYRRSEVSPLDKSATTRHVNRTRHERLVAKFGDELPPNWKELTDSQIDAVFVWKQRRAEGWLHLEELNSRLELPKQERGWISAIELPTVSATGFECLFQPISFDELVSHPKFSEALRKTFPSHMSFLLKVMFNESAKASFLAGLLSE